MHNIHDTLRCLFHSIESQKLGLNKKQTECHFSSIQHEVWTPSTHTLLQMVNCLLKAKFISHKFHIFKRLTVDILSPYSSYFHKHFTHRPKDGRTMFQSLLQCTQHNNVTSTYQYHLLCQPLSRGCKV